MKLESMNRFRRGHMFSATLPFEGKILFWYLLVTAVLLFLLAPLSLQAQFSGDVILAVWPQGSPTGHCSNCIWMDYRNPAFNVQPQAVTAYSINGRIVVDGVKYTSIAAGLAALPSSGGCVYLPPGYTEKLRADIVIKKSNSCLYFDGAATITAGTFRLTKASGIHHFSILSNFAQGFFGAASAVKWVYTGRSSSMSLGDTSADSVGVLLENFAIDISRAGSAASCITLTRTQRFAVGNVECNGAGGAITQVGLTLDGTGTFAGDSNIMNFVGGALFTCLKFSNSSNANIVQGGACPAVVASGKGIDIQSGNGNIIQGFDIEDAPTGVNIAASANNFGNLISIYGQGNATDFVIGSGAIANTVQNIGANCSTIKISVTDSGTNTNVINPCKLRIDANGTIKTSASILAAGTAATLSGTGACAATSTQTGGAMAGRATCTGTTGPSTLTITPGQTATNGWICYVQDQTTRANLFQQTSTTSTACTLTATSVTQNDVFVFQAIAF